MPDNGGAGYVIRRILRRAVRYYYSFLDLREPVLYRLCPVLAEEFSDVFPELKAQIDFVSKVILEEEKSFLRTLESGLKRFENLDIQHKTVTGEQAFELLDTFGFPIDLTRLIAREKGLTVDDAGFEKALAEQKARSRKDAAKQVGDWLVLRDEADVEFVGYDLLETLSSYIVKYRSVTSKGAEQIQVVLNRTPFYPEGGGQVGDQGWMTFGNEKIRVLDTKKENTLIIHILEKLPEALEDESVKCEVDSIRRRRTESNHSATHLLHAALRQVLGTHVQQKGSYLDDQALRFDFQHFQKVNDDELARIEHIVNEHIRQNIPLEEKRHLPIEEAKKAGATMLFGEKYGESVRMITFDPGYSRELCGGCHVSHTGKIGYFKITAESAVAAGVRRIEAVTAEGAEQYVGRLESEMAAIKNVLKAKDLVKGVADLQEDNKRLQKEIEHLVQAQANSLREGLRPQFTTIGGVAFLGTILPLSDANAIKTLAYELERETGNCVIAFGSVNADKPLLTVRISDNLVKEKGLSAGTIVRELAAKFLKGGGGGQPGFATAGGSETSGLKEAVDAVKGYL
jgi:alanyl-tRNA synthetase